MSSSGIIVRNRCTQSSRRLMEQSDDKAWGACSSGQTLCAVSQLQTTSTIKTKKCLVRSRLTVFAEISQVKIKCTSAWHSGVPQRMLTGISRKHWWGVIIGPEAALCGLHPQFSNANQLPRPLLLTKVCTVCPPSFIIWTAKLAEMKSNANMSGFYEFADKAGRPSNCDASSASV